MGQNQVKRLKLDKAFREICKNVYYQPPSNVKMSYPAIRYRRATIDMDYADNVPYATSVGYEVTVIDRDPDSEIVEAISLMPYTRHNRHYTSDNLNHDVFLIYV